MNIAILGGSFNPIHIGHLWIAQQVLEYDLLRINEIWLMPNHTSKNYSNKEMASWHDRHGMCKLAIEDFETTKMKICDIEEINQFEFTYQTIDYLVKHYPKDRFYWIIGSDWDITKFKNYIEILKKCRIIIMERNGYEQITNENASLYLKLQNYLILGLKHAFNFKISSTEIRNRVKNNMKITGLVTPSVDDYIQGKGLYNG